MFSLKFSMFFAPPVESPIVDSLDTYDLEFSEKAEEIPPDDEADASIADITMPLPKPK